EPPMAYSEYDNTEASAGPGPESQSSNAPLVPMDLVQAHQPHVNGVNGRGTPLVPAALSMKPNALMLLRSLKRRWLLASMLGPFAAASPAAPTCFLVPVTWTASTILFISPTRQVVVGQDPGADFAIYQRTQAAIIKQRYVLIRALRPAAISELSIVREKPEPV